MIGNYPSFSIVFDRNEYSEFKRGQFRCKRCRKYLRLSKMTCKHDNKCKTFYILKKKETLTFTLNAAYQDEESFDFSDEIDKKIETILEKRRKSMLERINDLLFKK